MTRRCDHYGDTCPRGMSRRDFLKLVALTGVLTGCRSLPAATTPAQSKVAGPTPTLAVTATPVPRPTVTLTPSAPVGTGESASSRVAFVKTNDCSAGVQRAIDLLGINPVLGKTVFIKPNFNSSDPAPASTHRDTWRALALKLREMGATQITIGDRSGGPEKGKQVSPEVVLASTDRIGIDAVGVALLRHFGTTGELSRGPIFEQE